VQQVGFIIRIYHDARSPERQIRKFMWERNKTLSWSFRGRAEEKHE